VGPFSSLHPVVLLSFDPIASVGGLSVRLETLAIAGVILVTLLVSLVIAYRTPVDLSLPAGAPSEDPDDGPNHLSADDLLYIAVAALPGAVAGGRLGYWLLHLDYYRANPGAIFDISQGGLQLSLAIVGGALTASIVAGLLGAPLGRWFHALALPLLLAIAGGKAAMILGGTGQGQPWDGTWATAYLGDGPWGSLAPALPSWPSQGLEALATVAVLGLMCCAVALGVFRGRTGAAFFFALGAWSVARALVATTWRDPLVVGSLRMDQLISVAIAAACALVLIMLAGRQAVSRRRTGPEPA
jgi:phosphatidylglycerol---prolipoprotein diacylglyceryl transferase